jgi:hypothetical protein
MSREAGQDLATRMVLSSGRIVHTIECDGNFFVKSGRSVHGPYDENDNRFSKTLA